MTIHELSCTIALARQVCLLVVLANAKLKPNDFPSAGSARNDRFGKYQVVWKILVLDAAMYFSFFFFCD